MYCRMKQEIEKSCVYYPAQSHGGDGAQDQSSYVRISATACGGHYQTQADKPHVYRIKVSGAERSADGDRQGGV